MTDLSGAEQITILGNAKRRHTSPDDLAERAAEGDILARAAHFHSTDSVRAWFQQMNGEGPEEQQPVVVLTSVNPSWEASGADFPGGIYRCVGGSPCFIGFGGYPLNRPALVDLYTGTATLYAGDGTTVWRGTDDLMSVNQVQLTSVVFDNATSTITFGGGDPVAEGFAVNDVVQCVNVATNNLTLFQIRAFGGTSNRTLTVWPEPTTDAVADTAFTFRRRGRTALTFTAPQLIMVHKSQGDIAASALTLSTTSTNTAPPTPSVIRAKIGQSWDVREAAAARRGAALTRQAEGLASHVNLIDAATGAQAVATQEPVTANGLWDIVGNQPAKNYAGSLLRIQRVMRNYPGLALKHVDVTLGVGDVENLTINGGWLTWQNMRAAYEAAIARYVSDMNSFSAGAGDALRFWIGPMQSINQSQGLIPYDDRACNLVRFVQMSVVARNANCRRGIERHHRAQAWDDVHQTERVMGLIGAELEAAWLRDDNSATYPYSRGPKVTGMTIEDDDEIRLTIARAGGLTGVNVGLLVKPVDSIPYGIAICPNGDLTAAPVEIKTHRWVGDDLILKLASAVTDPIPVYPYGNNHYAPFNWSALIWAYERRLGQYQVLQTIAHTYDDATGKWTADFTT